MTDDVEQGQEADDSGQDSGPEVVSEQPLPDGSVPDESDESDIEAASDDAADDARDSLDGRVPQIEVDDQEVAVEPDVADAEDAVAEDADAESAPSDTGLPDAIADPDSPKVPWWPFLVLLAVWLGVVTGSFFTLSYESAAAPLIQQEAYPYVILAGLVLAILGPIMSLTVWFIMWLRAGKGHREGLLTVSLVRGAGVTLLGVLAWWGTIVALDALRLGLIG